MDYPALSLPELTKISHHSFATLYQNKITGEKSLLAAIAIKAGNIFGTFESSEILTKPNKYTVQVNENTHIILSPEVLQYINHSCNPNVFFDTTTFELSALRDIAKGDEFTFFYPSTEWNMESPFNCFCGENNCLHKIQGASYLSPETISRYRFTDFIFQKLNISHLQIV
ncbi:MAG TPA: SET domain-containing protein-lysine N-methyltransferase [Hanamia sp.]|nr:SET domain-containing protein-lysine N-methyltransferase [Hanamia sp.]